MAGTIIADSIQADTGSAAVSILSNTGTTVMTFGQRITGDFSNATVANRVMFQTSGTNLPTSIGAIPNGTSNISLIQLSNNSTPINSSIADLRVTATEVRLAADIFGTGTYLPMTFFTGGSERMRIGTGGDVAMSGNVAIGGTSNGTRLYVQKAAGANFIGEVYLTDGTQFIIQNSNNSAGSYNPLFQQNDSCIVYSSGTQNNGSFAIAQWSTSQRGIRIDGTGNFQFNSGYGSVATAYGCRAWVNFDGTSNSANLTGTYSQTGTTVTATVTSHGLIAGSVIFSDITSGTAVDGTYTVATATDANTFTYTAGTSLTTSGNLTLRRNAIRGSGNVTSITDNGVGDYTVNFSVAMPDANYSPIITSQLDQGGGAGNATMGSGIYRTAAALSTGSFRMYAAYSTSGGQAQADMTTLSVAIFR